MLQTPRPHPCRRRHRTPARPHRHQTARRTHQAKQESLNMRRQRDSFGEILLKLPWWLSVLLGLLAFAAVRWGLPAWAGNDTTRQILTKGIVPLAPLAP